MSDLLYGRNAVREALRAGRFIQRIYIAEPSASALAPAPVQRGRPPARTSGKGKPGAKATPRGALPERDTRAERRVSTTAGRAPLEEISSLAHAKKVPVERVPGERLDKLTNKANHQGVAALAAEYKYLGWGDMLERIGRAGSGALVLILDSLQDPQNFGTLLRTAEAARVTGVIIPEHRTAGITPAVCNSSSGAVEYLKISRAPNLARAIQELKEAGVWVWALAGDDGAQNYSSASLTGPVGLVVGAEGSGVSRLVRTRCDGVLKLPMHGHIDSLNAAVAGSIAIYEVLRQREGAGEVTAPDADEAENELEAADLRRREDAKSFFIDDET